MKRRDALKSLLALAAYPAAASAYSERVPRIGVFLLRDTPFQRHCLDAFKQGLERLGHAPGRDIDVEHYFVTPDGQRVLRNRLRRLWTRVDVLVSAETSVPYWTHSEAPTVPLVQIGAFDPVLCGFADSLKRPGRNITGIAFPSMDDPNHSRDEYFEHWRRAPSYVDRLLKGAWPATMAYDVYPPFSARAIRETR